MNAAVAVVWPVPPPAIPVVPKVGLDDDPWEIKGTPLVALGEIPPIVDPLANTPIWY